MTLKTIEKGGMSESIRLPPGSIFPGLWQASSFLLMATFLSACQSLPSRGESFVMKINSIPTTRIQLQERPELSLALKRGVTRNDVTSSRLVLSHCYIENETPLQSLRFGATLLPEDVTVKPGDIIEITAEEASSGDIPFSRFFGRYVGMATSTPSNFFSHDNWQNLFRCGPVSPSGTMRVEVISFAHYWDFDFAQAEESRNSGINEEELRNGRIATGECSPGVDSWARWKVRLPPGLDAKIGDYLEATAGSIEGTTSTGPISEAVCKVVPPGKEHFVKTQGSDTISCKAPAIPFSKGE